MNIFDVTNIMPYIDNQYLCNMSIAQIGKTDNFLAIFRSIKYQITDEKHYHPWQMWSRGDKIFDTQSPCSVSGEYYNLQHSNSKRTIFKRFRRENKLFDQITTTFPLKTDIKSWINIKNLQEFDSTGACIIRKVDKGFVFLCGINNIFGDFMTHDTRIVSISCEPMKFILTYNSYIDRKLRMLTCNLSLEIGEDMVKIKVYDEKYLLNTKYTIEKNCTFINSSKIIYHTHPFTIYDIQDNTFSISDVTFFDSLSEYYNDEIFISSSTPACQYYNHISVDKSARWLAVGHYKIDYVHFKNQFSEKPFGKWLKNIDLTNINIHGKFIYFMYFYEFSTNKITRISHAFIPTNVIKSTSRQFCRSKNGQYSWETRYLEYSHEPYLLVFPMSLIKVGNKFLVGYGEGDTKCKILEISEEYIEQIMMPIDTLTPEIYQFTFLSDSWFNKKLTHIGYFREWNCGDDAFSIIWSKLRELYYPNFSLRFDKKYDQLRTTNTTTILGGGDVIHPYYVPLKGKYGIHAVSVGIPNTKYASMVNNFDYILLRNSRDLQYVANTNNVSADAPIISAGALGSAQVFPDMVFLMRRLFDIKCDKPSFHIKKVGFCLSRHQKMSESLLSMIGFLLNKGLYVYIIPFCINGKSYEDDRVLINEILIRFPSINAPKIVKKYPDYVFSVINILSKMDVLVCERFHAHIFSVMLEKPFLSISKSRKCVDFMSENGLESLFVDQYVEKWSFLEKNIALIYDKIKDLYKKIDVKITEFMIFYIENIIYTSKN